MRVAVLGGTFDPIHNGHIEVAEIALEQLEVDKVLFVPAGQQPFKEKSTLAKDRFLMILLTLRGHERMKVSRVEIDRPGKSYTVDTLDILAESYPDPILIIGADKLPEISRWRNSEKLIRTYEIALVPRKSYNIDDELVKKLQELGARITILTKEPVELSSTNIREKVSKGKDVSNLLHPLVNTYVNEKPIYKEMVT